MIISVTAKLFTIIYMINVTYAGENFDGFSKDVESCHFHYILEDADDFMGYTNKTFCEVFHPGFHSGNDKWSAAIDLAKKIPEHVRYCRFLIAQEHLQHCTETPADLKTYAEYCKDKDLNDSGCVALIDHFNQYCFDLAQFQEKIKPKIDESKEFLKSFNNYKIKLDDWEKFTNPIVKFETCTNEFNDADKYQGNLKAIEAFIAWSAGKEQNKISCTCNVILAIHAAVESNIIKLNGSSIDDKLKPVFDLICLSNLPAPIQKRFHLFTPEKYVGFFSPKLQNPLNIDPSRLIKDLVLLSKAGWNENTYNSSKFKDILDIINYSSSDSEKTASLVQAGILADMTIAEIKNLATNTDILKRTASSVKECVDMLFDIDEIVNNYYVKAGAQGDTAPLVKTQSITKAYKKKIQHLYKKILSDEVNFDETYCKFAFAKNEIWIKNIIFTAVNAEIKKNFSNASSIVKAKLPDLIGAIDVPK